MSEYVELAVPVQDDDHVRGAPDAPVTLVEYGDFECPFCIAAYPAVRALERTFGDRLRVVFRSFPLEQHPHAHAAAEAAEFAADRGRFWEMHDALYEARGKLALPDLLAQARRLGLDAGELEAALRDGVYRAIVDEVKDGGEESGIPGTPAFFLNGLLFEDEPSEQNLGDAIRWLLENGTPA